MKTNERQYSRNHEIAQKRREGWTLGQLAMTYRITKQRVHQILRAEGAA